MMVNKQEVSFLYKNIIELSALTQFVRQQKRHAQHTASQRFACGINVYGIQPNYKTVA